MRGEGAAEGGRIEAPESRLIAGEETCSCDRRAVLKTAVAVGVAASLPSGAQASPRMARPQPGDRFVFAVGEKSGTEIKPEDLSSGAQQVLAWPIEPETRALRDGSRLNQVVLVRLEPGSLDEVTRGRAAEGIVAYAASCTHALCPVTGWKDDKKVFSCQCHASEFDPRQGGKVVFGPAPRPLPALALKIEDGALVAGGTFIGRVGLTPS